MAMPSTVGHFSRISSATCFILASAIGMYASYSRYSVACSSPRLVSPRTIPVKIAAAPVLVNVIFASKSFRSISSSVMERMVGKFIIHILSLRGGLCPTKQSHHHVGDLFTPMVLIRRLRRHSTSGRSQHLHPVRAGSPPGRVGLAHTCPRGQVPGSASVTSSARHWREHCQFPVFRNESPIKCVFTIDGDQHALHGLLEIGILTRNFIFQALHS